MPTYQDELSVWLNASKNGQGCYLKIKNDSKEPITINPGESLYANMFTKMPIAKKQVRIEDVKEVNIDDINDDIPFN